MLVTRLVRLLGYLLLTLGLLPSLVPPFKQAVWASENAAVLSSPYVHHLWGNDKRLPATLTAWKEVDLAYDRLFSYDRSRQPHPPAGCVVLPAISHNIYQQGTGITTPPAVLMLRCRERIDLLRPARWVRSRLRAQNRQGYLLVSMPEMGIMDVQVHMVAVKSSAFNPSVMDMKLASSRPVIGLFIHHTMNVRQYTFEDTLTGKVDRVKATPNHPFYVVNQQRYIPVSRLSTHDQLINVLGHPVTLVCPKGKTSHCGQPYHPGQVLRVYNLEVYGQHRYFVGKPGIMVHNGYYDHQCTICQKSYRTPADLKRHLVTHTGERPFKCEKCGKTYTNPGVLMNHVKASHSGERPFKCRVCSRDFALKQHLKQHFRSKTHMDAAAEAASKMNIDTLTPADVSSGASAPSPSKETKQMEERARSRSPIMPIQELAQFYGDDAKEKRLYRETQ